MQIAKHPYLEGVLCRSDGACLVPSGRAGPSSHWTFGTKRRDGYRQIGIRGRIYSVHRLMAETFLQCPIPAGMQIDHIDRCPSNNKLENIRIVTPSENQRNRAVYAKYGIPSADKSAYMHARYANNTEYREKQKARARAYYAEKKARGLVKRKDSDGKYD